GCRWSGRRHPPPSARSPASTRFFSPTRPPSLATKRSIDYCFLRRRQRRERTRRQCMRHSLVIGGAGGTCAAVCEALAETGGPVTIADRNGEAAAALAENLAAKGYAARGEDCDASSAAAIELLKERAESKHGPVDVLVTMAGVIRNDLLVKVKDED